MNNSVKPHCVLLSTGGTIASKIDPKTGLALPTVTGEELFAKTGASLDNVAVTIEQFSQVPSPHMSIEEWIRLSKRVTELLTREDVNGVVISHGTATLEETAWFLDLTVRSSKPVVMVGAQRNQSEADSDGTRNLVDGIKVSLTQEARGQGVLVVLNQRVHCARDVSKQHTVNVETFNSGEWGCIGRITPDKVIFRREAPQRTHVPLTTSSLPLVEVVAMYVGASANAIHGAMAGGAKGIVIQATASGHVNPEVYEGVLAALNKGIKVVVATRVTQGGTRACYGFDGSSARLQQAGAILAGELSAWKARILLMLLLQNEQGEKGIEGYFEAQI